MKRQDHLDRMALAREANERAQRRAAEDARIARQRELWRQSGFGPDKAALKEAMLERVRDLLDIGEAVAADALLEFLPEADAEKLLDEYFAEEAAG